MALDSTISALASIALASDSQASALVAAVVAASDKTRPWTSRVTNTPSFFYYTVMDGDLYSDVIRMLQAIDLKSEKLNPIHDLHNEQHRSETYNFTSVMFL